MSGGAGWAGMGRIVRFNWPWYAAAVATIAAGTALLLSSPGLWPAASALVLAGLVAAVFWLLTSLAVSHYVYDRSGVARGEWLGLIDPGRVRRAAVLHAGQDEATAIATGLLPRAEWHIFDFHAPSRSGTPSLRRARAAAAKQGGGASVEAIAPDAIPLEDGALDLELVVFAAHEIRRESERAAFFGELGRVLAPGGRLIVVEHLRDAWNLLAYGPGALHFLSRATWGRAFAAARLSVLDERRCTLFVRVVELGRAR